MPKVRRQRKTRRYSPYKKRRTVDSVEAITQKLNPRQAIYAFPEQNVTKIRYSDIVTLTSSGGGIPKYVFNMNSCYDPDFSGVGHQPIFWDQLTAVYGRYVVLGSKLKATFSPIANTNTTTQPSGPMIIGIMTDHDTTTPTTLSTLIESSRSKSTFLNNAMGGNNVKSMSVTYSPAISLGVDKEDDQVHATTSASPSRAYYAHVFMSETGLATSSSCEVKIDIEYTVRLYAVKDVSGS